MRMLGEIDVDNCVCYDPEDKKMVTSLPTYQVLADFDSLVPPLQILSNIVDHHGSTAAFNASLKLQLLLVPTSYKVDMDQLTRRSEGTTWDFHAATEWLTNNHNEADASTPRCLCVLGPAGTGKSTVSAALLREVLGRPVEAQPGEWQGPVTAAHFLKHSDASRQEPLIILQSLAFQIARRVPAAQEKLFSLLDSGELTRSQLQSDAETAFKLLFLDALVPACEGELVVILIDALDEGDPAEQQRADFDKSKHSVTPVGNKALRLLISLLAKLPRNFVFICTTRPDAVLGDIEAILNRTFPGDGGGGVLFLEPGALRQATAHSSTGAQEGNLVLATVVQECDLSPSDFLPDGDTAASLEDLYAAYEAIFRDSPHNEGVVEVLEVLLAAQEPLSLAVLERMGLKQHLEELSGWGCLFFTSDHRVYFLSVPRPPSPSPSLKAKPARPSWL